MESWWRWAQGLPDFDFTGQDGRTARSADPRGDVVAIDFIYTRCPLPNLCLRVSANFAIL